VENKIFAVVLHPKSGVDL